MPSDNEPTGASAAAADSRAQTNALLDWMVEHADDAGWVDVLALGRPPTGVRLILLLLPAAAVSVLATLLAYAFHGRAVAVVIGVLALVFCIGVQAVATTTLQSEPGPSNSDTGAGGTTVTWSVRAVRAHLFKIAAYGTIAFLAGTLIALTVEWTNSAYDPVGAYALCRPVPAAEGIQHAAVTGVTAYLATIAAFLPIAGLREADPRAPDARRSGLVTALMPGGGVWWTASLALPVVIVEHYVGVALAGLASAEEVPMWHSLPGLRLIPRIGVAWRNEIAAAPAGRIFPSLLWCVLAVAVVAVIAYAVTVVAELQFQAYRRIALRSLARQAEVTRPAQDLLAAAVDAGLVTRNDDRYHVLRSAAASTEGGQHNGS